MRPDHPLRLRAQTLATSNNANMAVSQLRMPAKKLTFQTNDLDLILKNGDIIFKDHLDKWTLRTLWYECLSLC